jgi:hypothetical protein
MHGISSASPSHVRIGSLCYDVVLWGLNAAGLPFPGVVMNGRLVMLDSYFGGNPVTLHNGTAAQAEADGREA